MRGGEISSSKQQQASSRTLCIHHLQATLCCLDNFSLATSYLCTYCYRVSTRTPVSKKSAQWPGNPESCFFKKQKTRDEERRSHDNDVTDDDVSLFETTTTRDRRRATRNESNERATRNNGDSYFEHLHNLVERERERERELGYYIKTTLLKARHK